MHIALLISGTRLVDVERTLQLLHFMQASGASVTIFLPHKSHIPLHKEYIASLILHEVPFLECPVRIGYNSWLARILEASHTQSPFDALFALQADAASTATIVKKFIGRHSLPLIFGAIGSVQQIPSSLWALLKDRWQVSLYARYASYIWSDNLASFSLLQARQFAVNHSVYIPLHTVDVEKIRAVPAPPVAWDISVVTPLRGDHRLADLIDIVQSIANCRLLVIGDGPDKPKLLTVVKERQLDGRIQFTGWFPRPSEVISSIKSTRMFVCTAAHLQSQYMLLQAMACQVPVVVWPSEFTSGIIDHDTNGLVTTGEPADLKEKIMWCLENRERRAYLAERAMHDIERFHLSNITQRWQDFISAVKTRSSVQSMP